MLRALLTCQLEMSWVTDGLKLASRAKQVFDHVRSLRNIKLNLRICDGFRIRTKVRVSEFEVLVAES